MDPKCEVHPYSIDTLERIVAEKSNNDCELIRGKFHRQYFSGYFEYIKGKTIVVENDYIDHDYLEDYAAYYVRCFTSYPKTCTRLHFFKSSFSNDDFDHLLRGENAPIDCSSLANDYLGFIVIKSLPKTVIGRTCLATYPQEGRRHFPITRDYLANLFGINLSVKTLAFQEQDKTVSACATSALWSVFQGTGKLFQHPIPSPVEITKVATAQSPIDSRSIPNQGLTYSMMACAIRSVSLEPFLVNVGDPYLLKSNLYAYLRGGIPMILGIELCDVSTHPPSSLGHHAVAVTGYNLNVNVPSPHVVYNLALRASRIDKIYVHDDQIGPFARMELDGVNVVQTSPDGPVECASLSTSWIGKSGEMGSVRARPVAILVPLYHKIRIPFEAVHNDIVEFNDFIEILRNVLKIALPFNGRLEWDIYLSNVNVVKNEILCSKQRTGDYYRDVLLETMPKYLWRAVALDEDKPILELLFDATDIEHGQTLVRVIEHDEQVGLALRVVSKIEGIQDAYKSRNIWKILQWFRKQHV